MIDFIHIGLNKTGTTFLQNGLFAEHPDLQVFGSNKFPTLENKQLFTIVSYLNNSSSLFFDDDYFRNYLNEMIGNERIDNRLVGISAEGFSGSWRDGKNVKFIATKLKENFGNIKIILCLREQFSMLESNYNQFLKRGGTTTFEECFFSPFFGEGMIYPDSTYGTNVLAYFQYSYIVKEYFKLFGKKNVKVIFYEDLKAEPKKFQNDICEFLGITENVSETGLRIEKNTRLTKCSLKFLRFINRLFNTKFHHIQGRPSLLDRLLYKFLRQKYPSLQKFEVNPYLLHLEFNKRLQKKLANFIQYKIDPLLAIICKNKLENITSLENKKRAYIELLYKNDNAYLCSILGIEKQSLKARGYLVSESKSSE